MIKNGVLFKCKEILSKDLSLKDHSYGSNNLSDYNMIVSCYNMVDRCKDIKKISAIDLLKAIIDYYGDHYNLLDKRDQPIDKIIHIFKIVLSGRSGNILSANDICITTDEGDLINIEF